MEIKNDGVLVELDPKKEYIMLIESDFMTQEQASQIKQPLNGLILYGHNIAKGVKFIENSDKIVGIKYFEK